MTRAQPVPALDAAPRFQITTEREGKLITSSPATADQVLRVVLAMLRDPRLVRISVRPLDRQPEIRT